MRGLIWGITTVALLAAACDSGGAGTTVLPSTVTTPATTAVTTVPEPTATELLEEFIAAVGTGDAAAAFALLAPDAAWALGGIELRLGSPLPEELEWLPGAVGVAESSPDAVVRGLLELQVALESRPAVAECGGDDSAQACAYSVPDALTAVLDRERRGTITLETRGGRIVRLATDIPPVADPTGAGDPFRRWSAIQNPDVRRDLPLLAWANAIVPLAAAWDAAGRPDVPRPPEIGSDPFAVVAAFVHARNRGDWETMVSLLGGPALDDPFGSRDEFDAARLLQRVITLEECGSVLESPSGVRIGCRVSVTDIIVAAAGIAPTNPNQSTFQVAAGRVTALPQFLPSSFLAERALEEWAMSHAPESYANACPNGIAGQSPIDGLPCARFIAEHQAAWQSAVAALGQ